MSVPTHDPATAWQQTDLANPHAVADKAGRVEKMFSAIAPSYDLNNRVHSLWRDQAWRRAAVKMAALRPGDTVLDVACGTGDLAMAFGDAGAARVIGVDFTFNMLTVAVGKKTRDPRPEAHLSYQAGDAMRLPVADQSVDVVSIAFGIRNVADPRKAIGEFYRVLRPGGRLIILEFSLPTNPLMRRLYNFYFTQVLPRTATFISHDRTGAYKYLPRSVNTFIDRPAMLGLMGEAGFTQTQLRTLTMGVAVVYRGVKP